MRIYLTQLSYMNLLDTAMVTESTAVDHEEHIGMKSDAFECRHQYSGQMWGSPVPGIRDTGSSEIITKTG